MQCEFKRIAIDIGGGGVYNLHRQVKEMCKVC